MVRLRNIASFLLFAIGFISRTTDASKSSEPPTFRELRTQLLSAICARRPTLSMCQPEKTQELFFGKNADFTDITDPGDDQTTPSTSTTAAQTTTPEAPTTVKSTTAHALKTKKTTPTVSQTSSKSTTKATASSSSEPSTEEHATKGSAIEKRIIVTATTAKPVEVAAATTLASTDKYEEPKKLTQKPVQSRIITTEHTRPEPTAPPTTQQPLVTSWGRDFFQTIKGVTPPPTVTRLPVTGSGGADDTVTLDELEVLRALDELQEMELNGETDVIEIGNPLKYKRIEKPRKKLVKKIVKRIRKKHRRPITIRPEITERSIETTEFPAKSSHFRSHWDALTTTSEIPPNYKRVRNMRKLKKVNVWRPKQFNRFKEDLEASTAIPERTTMEQTDKRPRIKITKWELPVSTESSEETKADKQTQEEKNKGPGEETTDDHFAATREFFGLIEPSIDFDGILKRHRALDDNSQRGDTTERSLLIESSAASSTEESAKSRESHESDQNDSNQKSESADASLELETPSSFPIERRRSPVKAQTTTDVTSKRVILPIENLPFGLDAVDRALRRRRRRDTVEEVARNPFSPEAGLKQRRVVERKGARASAEDLGPSNNWGFTEERPPPPSPPRPIPLKQQPLPLGEIRPNPDRQGLLKDVGNVDVGFGVGVGVPGNDPVKVNARVGVGFGASGLAGELPIGQNIYGRQGERFSLNDYDGSKSNIVPDRYGKLVAAIREGRITPPPRYESALSLVGINSGIGIGTR